MQTIYYPKREEWASLLTRPAIDSTNLTETVSGVLDAVRVGGDTAIRRFAKEFDGVSIENLKVSDEEFVQAEKNVSYELKDAIGVAKANIEKFHAPQTLKEEIVETTTGVFCWRKSVAIEKVGLYIPGGTAPLFSTVLMLGIPAKIAGCKEIILCSPAGKNGRIHDAILYAARLCGVTSIFKIGGAQAIAAMAYGTQTVPTVYKIFGPGNQYVTAAKQMVLQTGTSIDMPAGPSELAILADKTCVPEFVAADLLSQAEHGADSQILLVSTDENVINAVIAVIERQVDDLPRRRIAEKALANSKAILLNIVDEAIDLINEYAAEHLILAIENADRVAERIINAGSVFIGNYSCESAGDYASGTNHTLPTNGYAKAFSGVSTESFTKKITFQKLTAEGMANLGPTIELMAEAEGLQAHKNAISIRLREITG